MWRNSLMVDVYANLPNPEDSGWTKGDDGSYNIDCNGTHQSSKQKCNRQSTFSPRVAPVKRVAKLNSVAAEKMAVSMAQDVNVKAVPTYQSRSLKQVDMERRRISEPKNPKL